MREDLVGFETVVRVLLVQSLRHLLEKVVGLELERRRAQLLLLVARPQVHQFLMGIAIVQLRRSALQTGIFDECDVDPFSLRRRETESFVGPLRGVVNSVVRVGVASRARAVQRPSSRTPQLVVDDAPVPDLSLGGDGAP